MLVKIVALDTFAADFDGLSWAGFSDLGEFTSYPYTESEKRLERIADATAVIVNKVRMDAEIFQACPSLRYIGVTATGVNNVDLEAAKQAGISVCNVPGYSTSSVAQLVFAYILHHFTQVVANSSNELIDRWLQVPYFSLQQIPSIEIKDKTLGIIGLGEIGQQVRRIAEAFDMKVIAAALPGRSYTSVDVTRKSLDQTLKESDIITLHCPLTEETANLINKETLSQMKPGAILINTSRGGVLDEQALADALSEGKPAFAYLDVLSKEPPGTNNPLVKHPKTLITAHIAWATREARMRLIAESCENLRAFTQGTKRNSVV